jgi:stage II sporulation protein P
MIYEGDELIAEDNKHYRISKVERTTAYAQYIGKHDINPNEYTSASILEIAQNTNPKNNLVAIYHTHSDESYVKGDGTESKPSQGGVFDIGEIFAQKLEKNGINAVHSKNSHEPHDSNAYRRSRRTAVDLMKKAPSVLIDIHRDGIKDPNFYSDNISGVNATKTRLVVGRQNQNMQSNLEFAKNVKARINKMHPGLIKEIFIAKGNYNQDLSPRTLLIEVGTYTNGKDQAKNGAALFADALPKVLGIAGGPGGNAPQNRSDWTSVIWILAAVIIAGGAFLLISTGSFTKAKEKLKEITSIEWANFLGQRVSKKELLKDENDDKAEKRDEKEK